MSKAFHETSAVDYKPSDPKERTSMTTLFHDPAEPKTPLGVYRLLAPTAGIRVSPLCLGAMSLGNQWDGFMGGKGLNQEESEKMLDTFYEAGGNFIDVANGYQDEQSEHIIGEWMEKRGIRDEIVLATKYTTYAKYRQNTAYPGIGVNFAGNHKKSLAISLADSLRKLRTTYVDILYVHWWDHSTSIPELMQSLNDMVRSGKVLYLGISDTPAWIVAQANEYARQNALAQFVVYQGAFSLAMRDMERDIIPMCRNNGMSIAPYAVLGQGFFKTPEELEQRSQLRGDGKPSEQQLKASKALKEVADEIGGGVHLAHIAMAWARQVMADCFPILGGTNIDHLKGNIEALNITLTDAQIQKLDQAVPFSHGFPTGGHFGLDPRGLPGHEPNGAMPRAAGRIKYTPYPAHP